MIEDKLQTPAQTKLQQKFMVQTKFSTTPTTSL